MKRWIIAERLFLQHNLRFHPLAHLSGSGRIRLVALYFPLRELARFIAPAFVASSALTLGGAVNASTLTKNLKAPSCCTPSVNSTFTESPAAIGVAVVTVMTVELSPPPFGCAGGVSTCVPLTGTTDPSVS